jgi:hypothetical protein
MQNFSSHLQKKAETSLAWLSAMSTKLRNLLYYHPITQLLISWPLP